MELSSLRCSARRPFHSQIARSRPEHLLVLVVPTGFQFVFILFGLIARLARRRVCPLREQALVSSAGSEPEAGQTQNNGRCPYPASMSALRSAGLIAPVITLTVSAMLMTLGFRMAARLPMR